ncbi:sodium-dependent transporter [Candidatus Neptunochlamydia vexilliferae]|uniref:Transporter n=1 Tax=Candidatus Neptunichlamydia vexilliferae TaxID=1651774 RepID=A0ABS0AZS1_9BACT|nr:sodium-dependent transporter [Candidatus Neptunochlamydia vexilliferae]MBF5058971.1 putative sodium-dependent transporter YhdH [Candidatus Neptunochlamydia vexilliferae]
MQREHWASHFGFIMAAAGSAIGLGSLWRFPYVAGDNGGGAFVLLYVIFTFCLGVPIFIGELAIGRKGQHSPIFAYEALSKKGSNWRLLGYLNLLTSFVILSFYCVVAGWCLNYALMSLNQFTVGKTPEEIRAVFDAVYASPGLNLFWLLIFILLNVGVVYTGIRKGIEHWSKILTPALLVILIALFIYGTTLPGFGDAVKFIFYPDFSKLTPSVILNSLGMAFFTLSVGMGIIVTYGSYLTPTENLPKTASIVALMTLLVSLIAALMIFPIVFTFNFPPEGGPGLIFQTMPVLFSKLPGSLVISTVFFLLFVFTALTSSISLLEVLVANLMELFSWKRHRAVIISSSAVFLFGIPSALAGSSALFPNWETVYGKNFFDTMNYISASWMTPVAALLTTFFIGFVMKKKETREEFLQGGALRTLFGPWLFIIRYIAPIVVILIILEQGGVVHLGKLLTP